MAKLKPASYVGGLKMTTAAERTGHLKSGLKQTGSTKVTMWGPLKGSMAQKSSLKMKRMARGW